MYIISLNSIIVEENELERSSQPFPPLKNTKGDLNIYYNNWLG